jgi:hypothetical protein
MRIVKRITRSNFFIKLTHWEYWPFGILQLPSIVYFLWLCLRSRSIVFFSASNPGIDMGGMFGESKYDVLRKIPLQYIPKTMLIKIPVSTEDVLSFLTREAYQFPVIFKPELGERGFMVKRIKNRHDVELYLQQTRTHFLVQELVDLPLEFGVFYARIPSQPQGYVTSVVMKEMLAVTGDGRSTLRELIMNKDRAKLQWQKLKDAYGEQLDERLDAGETKELVSIGNHALGTKFVNRNDLINEKLSLTFDQISKQIEGFYFGRFDLRCATLQDLYEGKVKIVELNGCGAEPAHIYDPDFKLLKAMGVLIKHWRQIFVIARENKQRGVQYTSLKNGIAFYKKFKSVTR